MARILYSLSQQNKAENKGVRPIGLTSHLGKLFESLIKNRLQWY